MKKVITLTVEDLIAMVGEKFPGKIKSSLEGTLKITVGDEALPKASASANPIVDFSTDQIENGYTVEMLTWAQLCRRLHVPKDAESITISNVNRYRIYTQEVVEGIRAKGPQFKVIAVDKDKGYVLVRSFKDQSFSVKLPMEMINLVVQAQ